MPLPWLRVALATLISIPVILIVLLSIRYKYSFKLNIKLGICAALFAIPVATTLILAPYWIESVQIKFVESARNFAKGRPYCVIKPVEGGYPVENPSIGELLFRATHDQGEYPTFYAMMIVEADSNVESMYWSFKELSFLNIPPTFGMYRIDKLPCRPVNDPLAAIANPE